MVPDAGGEVCCPSIAKTSLDPDQAADLARMSRH